MEWVPFGTLLLYTIQLKTQLGLTAPPRYQEADDDDEPWKA